MTATCLPLRHLALDRMVLGDFIRQRVIVYSVHMAPVVWTQMSAAVV